MSELTEQNIKDLEGLAKDCKMVGERLKVKEPAIAKDVWMIEDTLWSILAEIDKRQRS